MINYIKGDALKPIKTPAVIFHICNNKGGWGKGFVKAISKQWHQPELAYRNGIAYNKVSLGDMQLIQVEDDIFVCNMICQNGYKSSSNPVPLDYKQLRLCLYKLNELNKADDYVYSLHAPRIGSGNAGGNWNQIEEIIEDMIDEQTEIYIYTLD